MENRTGMINTTINNRVIEIIEYINAHNLKIKFDDGYIIKSEYKEFHNGRITHPNDKTLCGVGYLGIGDYKCSNEGERTKEYSYWHSMINRCYNEKKLNKKPTYKDCSVCEEWLNFQNFAKWFSINYYEVNNEQMHLDKDILYKGNKIYSPENCVFVPQRINDLFVRPKLHKANLPIGVVKNNDKFKAQCNINLKTVKIGVYSTIEEAFNAYKIHKEKHIKEIAEEYKNKTPKKLYDAMYKYKVEIAD